MERADHVGCGALGVLRAALQGLAAARSAEAAASIAYYALFSLFPLLLVLVAGVGFVLQSQDAQQRLLRFALEAFPVSQSVLERNIEQVLDRRGTIGVVGLLSLLWSGTGGLGVLVTNISRAWPEDERRSYVAYRLIALGTGILAALLALLVISTAVLETLPQLRGLLRDDGAFWNTRLWPILSDALPTLVAFSVFLSLYRWVPAARVRWSAALRASFVATLAWRLATWAFVWFLGNGLVRYEWVYGSLGAIVALLFWIYLSAQIALFGAHLCAALGQSARRVVTSSPHGTGAESGAP